MSNGTISRIRIVRNNILIRLSDLNEPFLRLCISILIGMTLQRQSMKPLLHLFQRSVIFTPSLSQQISYSVFNAPYRSSYLNSDFDSSRTCHRPNKPRRFFVSSLNRFVSRAIVSATLVSSVSPNTFIHSSNASSSFPASSRLFACSFLAATTCCWSLCYRYDKHSPRPKRRLQQIMCFGMIFSTETLREKRDRAVDIVAVQETGR